MTSDFKQNLSTEEQEIFINALVYILNTDKNFKPAKNEYLVHQAKEIGFPMKKLSTIKPIVKPETISNNLLKIHNVRLRRYFMREMIMLAISDHELTDTEMCNIYKIGTAIGIKQDKINDFFLWAAQGIEWQVEGVRLVEDDL